LESRSISSLFTALKLVLESLVMPLLLSKSDGDTSIKMELKEKPRNIKTDQGGDSNSFIMSICDDESDTEPEVQLVQKEVKYLQNIFLLS
jgi:hypothetical protein